MTAVATPDLTELLAEYSLWLQDFLPSDYYDNYAAYRWDIGLRRDHQLAAFEGGWLQPTWPRELGGHDLGPREAMAVRLESAMRAAPKLPNIASVNVVAPGLREFGTRQQQDDLLVPLLRGEHWWALGMSEPGSGSDFASLSTRADRSGEHYRLNGQKVWTTQAHESRWATVYARTDPGAAKHKGISCLLVDLASPGITVKPIRMATVTDETFCEVFLDDVMVPVENLLGGEGDGWRIAMASLEHERHMIWIMNWVQIQRGLQTTRDTGRQLGDDLLVSLGQRLADASALRATGYRNLESSLTGRRGDEGQILKLLGSESLQRTWELAAVATGSGSAVDETLTFERHDALAATIYGGTSEVQRNIIAERVLGLPKG